MDVSVRTLYNNFTTTNANTCMVVNEKRFTYSEMASMIASVQKALEEAPGNPLVGVVANNSAWTYAAILACWFSGKGFVPIHPAHPPRRNEEIIKLAGIQEVISSNKENPNIPHDIKRLTIFDFGQSSAPELIEVEKDHIACVLFTSGSTGVPKGVPMTFKNIESTMDAFFALGYNLSASDKFLQMFELTFDMSMLSYLPAWLLGAPVYTVGHDKIKYLEAVNIMQQHGITFAAMVPSTLSLLQPFFKKIQLPNLRYSLLGGEPFYEEMAMAWGRVVPNARIVNISGPTETTMACMGYDIDVNSGGNKTHNGILAFGMPWKNTLAVTVDEDLNMLNNEKVGELCFSGENVMSGYLNQSGLNQHVFFETEYKGKYRRFYRTGDMAFVDQDGIFHTCGRRDQQVKIQGFKVELEEIEKHARLMKGIKNAYALKGVAQGKEYIELFVESETVNENEVKEQLASVLPYYMHPARVYVFKQFPYTLNGKIDRVKLSSAY